MSDTFLSDSELVALTGFRARHCQARWLERNRWRFALNRHKEPRVARDHFNERMGCGARAATHAEVINQTGGAAQPDFAGCGPIACLGPRT